MYVKGNSLKFCCCLIVIFSLVLVVRDFQIYAGITSCMAAYCLLKNCYPIFLSILFEIISFQFE